MKGFVFSLDAAIAAFTAVAFLAAITFLLQASPNSQVPEISSVIIASDLVSAFEKNDGFDSLDVNTIAASFNQSLPGNLNISINLSIYYSNLTFQESKQINRDLVGNYYEGQWIFTIKNASDITKFVLANYKVGFQ